MRALFTIALIALGLCLAAPALSQPPQGTAKAGGPKAPKAKGAGKRKEHKPGAGAKKGNKGKGANPGKSKAAKEAWKDERSAAHRARDQKRASRLKKRAERLRSEGKEKAAVRLEERAATVTTGRELYNDKAEWKRQRDTKKLLRLKRLRKRYGKALKKKAVQEELSRNARVRAKLTRMQALAEEADDDTLLERVRALWGKEQLKHKRRMGKLAPVKKKKSNKKKPNKKKSNKKKSNKKKSADKSKKEKQ